ncbi:hypothetical protein [Streptomyces sp. NBC_00470]|uniref:hypothetical protein n=1 Tax=Streptomyces sp. NBC_00470 TaxID=2975753 RepID=UPI0030DF439E
MATNAYTGALTRSAHYAYRPPVPGINPEHITPKPDPDPFSPAPAAPGGVAGDVWQPSDLPLHTEMRVGPRPHTTPLQPPVPSNVHSDQRDRAWQTRLLANHGSVDYRPEQYPTYKHATQGRTLEYVDGRMPVEAGITVPDNASYLVAGTNAFDFTNRPNEVYAGDSANVGRYRLGKRVDDFGRYVFSQKQGQDAWLRGYQGLSPDFPADKPRVPDSAPYTPNSSGTTTWTLSQWQIPSMFGLPSETSLTDYQAANTGTVSGDAFDDGGRL